MTRDNCSRSGGIRAPTNQRYQGREIINVKDSSTSTKTIWTIYEGEQNHAEFKLRNLMCARSEPTVQLWRDDCFKCLTNFRTLFPNEEEPSSSLPWRVLGSVARCHEPSTQGIGSTSSIRCWGFNFKRARTVLKQVCNLVVMAVSRSCWRSLRAAKPAAPIRP